MTCVPCSSPFLSLVRRAERDGDGDGDGAYGCLPWGLTQPDAFLDERYALRQILYETPRRTELFIVMTMYNVRPLFSLPPFPSLPSSSLSRRTKTDEEMPSVGRRGPLHPYDARRDEEHSKALPAQQESGVGRGRVEEGFVPALLPAFLLHPFPPSCFPSFFPLPPFFPSPNILTPPLAPRSRRLYRLGRPRQDQLSHPLGPRCYGSLPGRRREERGGGETGDGAYLRVYDPECVYSFSSPSFARSRVVVA